MPGRTAVRRTTWGWALVIVLVLAAGCGERDKKREAPHPRLDSGAVVFPEGSPQLSGFHSEVAKGAAAEQLRLAGRTVWDEDRTVRLYPSFAGRVTRISVKQGDGVKAGQSLAQMASPDFGQAQMEARRAQSDFALAQKNLERLRELHAAGVSPRKDLNAVEAEHARAEAELARAASRMKLYGSSDSVDQNFALRSPISGTVVERNINPGQELRADMALGSGPAMFVITDPLHLWVQLDATERDLARLRQGMTVRIATPAWPDTVFKGRIVAISDSIDATTRTVKVRAAVENQERKLKGEMFVSAEIESPSPASVQVPAKGVFLAGEQYYVFVQEGASRFRRVEVKTSGEHGGMMGILSGVAAGQNVVVDGALFLQQIERQLATGAAL
jgi:cobalt-zinc-cadmium efflux system membrane fusion protein